MSDQVYTSLTLIYTLCELIFTGSSVPDIVVFNQLHFNQLSFPLQNIVFTIDITIVKKRFFMACLLKESGWVRSCF